MTFFLPTNPIQTYIDVFVNKLHKKTANAFVNLYIYKCNIWNKLYGINNLHAITIKRSPLQKPTKQPPTATAPTRTDQQKFPNKKKTWNKQYKKNNME